MEVEPAKTVGNTFQAQKNAGIFPYRNKLLKMLSSTTVQISSVMLQHFLIPDRRTFSLSRFHNAHIIGVFEP